MIKADAVFEGGGVKGIGLVGAICYFEKMNYEWVRLAGTSARAIVASLLAVGYTENELKNLLMNFDYIEAITKNTSNRPLKYPLSLNKINFFKDKGLYSGKEIENFVEMLLEKKCKTKFKDVYESGDSRLKIMATDITKKKLLILPEGLTEYGIDPMEFSIAKAVRMSIGLPFFLKPVKLYGKDV